jgi:hypothetical protein
VVQVYEYGEEGDYCFIAMEYVAGKPSPLTSGRLEDRITPSA